MSLQDIHPCKVCGFAKGECHGCDVRDLFVLTLETVECLVSDDALACQHPTVEQYRKALLEEIGKRENGEE